jgi:hypothetical protein
MGAWIDFSTFEAMPFEGTIAGLMVPRYDIDAYLSVK